jgi:hypothetical protein
VVQLGGLEPPTSCSTNRRSNQLSYNCILERPTISRSRAVPGPDIRGDLELGGN